MPRALRTVGATLGEDRTAWASGSESPGALHSSDGSRNQPARHKRPLTLTEMVAPLEDRVARLGCQKPYLDPI